VRQNNSSLVNAPYMQCCEVCQVFVKVFSLELLLFRECHDSSSFIICW